MKPRAFLSYRHNYDPEVTAKDRLETAINAQQKVELIFDKSVTEVGDCVIEFMRELIAARCIFLFISEDYFKSPYTLFELISISEHPEIESKIILPICVSSQMLRVFDFQQIKNYWDDHPEHYQTLDHLFRYQQMDLPKFDKEALWRRIDDAWLSHIFKYLNKLWDGEIAGDIPSLINQSVEELSHSATEKIKATSDYHRKIIKEQIIDLLNHQSVLVGRLARELGLPRNAVTAQVVDALVLDSAMSAQPIGCLTSAARDLKTMLISANPMDWKDAFQDIQQICGLLLLNTIDPQWWFNHELELGLQMQQGVIGEGYKLEDVAFVEVIISKELITQNSYSSLGFVLSPDNPDKVVSHQNNVNDGYNNMLFDGVSGDAVAVTLLGKIHQDLLPSTSIPNDAEGIIADIEKYTENIKNAAAAIKEASRQRPVYYIVSGSYLEQLKQQVWFPEFQEKLKGSLQFICCTEETIAGSGQATKESQKLLLSQVALLLKIDRN